MADTTLEAPEEAPEETTEAPAPRFTIHPLKPQSSIYADAVKALIDAEEHAEDQQAIDILVPGDTAGKNRHLRDFRQAATDAGRTARIRSQSEQPDGSIKIEFTLTEKVTRTRKSKVAE